MIASAPRLALEQLESRELLDATSFVTAVYQDVLKRSPDQAGLTFWVDQLESGQADNFEVGQGIWGSLEHRRQQVGNYYANILGRPADQSGLNFWVNRLLNGTDNELSVQAGFYSSPEFVAAHSNPSDYISVLYQGILGRAASPDENTFWQAQLAQFGAIFVSGAIITSTEKFLRVLDRYYEHFLDRPPDNSGINFWLPPLQSGALNVGQVAEGFIGSPEYANIN